MSEFHAELQQVLPGAIADAWQQTRENAYNWANVFPDHATENNFWTIRKPDDQMQVLGTNHGWTTGFWTGMMWLAWEFKHDAVLEATAEAQAMDFRRRVIAGQDVATHDLVLTFSLADVAAYKLLGDQKAREGALLAAEALMSRYHHAPGIIQAWGALDDPDQKGRTIVDSLMNTPLLVWAGEQTGDPKYLEAVRRHAVQLARNIIRPDGSMFHTFYWDTETGEPLRGDTHQGHSDTSCWARGQTWGIYGFTMGYQATHDPEVLRAAVRVANYYLDHLPPGLVPYWDLVFDDSSGEERDTSAAAIAYCGLVELAKELEAYDGEAQNPTVEEATGRLETPVLSDVAPDPKALAQRYREAADQMLYGLITRFTPRALGLPSDALLLESVYNKPSGMGINEATQWGDYFYLEALMRATNPNWSSYWM